MSSPETALKQPELHLQVADGTYDFDSFEEISLEGLGNPDLPIHEQRQLIEDALANNRVVIVKAPTGNGKSTQLPQYAAGLGFYDRIRQSQPRRRAALNVARRIREEIALMLGEDVANELVASQTGIGLEGDYDAKIMVMTEGVQSRRHMHDSERGLSDLWVLDEAHENSNEFWVLAGMAKRRLVEDPNFSVVVMTATPDLLETVEYWTDEEGVEPAVLELEGGTNFEIEHRIAEESNTAREGVKAAMDIFNNPDAHGGSNTVQIFESGRAEINDTIKEIQKHLPAEVRAKTRILPNHAGLTPEQQQPVYEDFDGIKIVVQTNIGKTSNTIPRTRYVIDSGMERGIIIDSEGAGDLIWVPSSRDCMTQKKGRGGRTSTSIYIHTRHGDELFIPFDDEMRREHLVPEIEHSKLDGIIMLLAEWGENIRDFNGKPSAPLEAIDIAMHRLQQLGALNEHEEITNLGKRMMKYPASPENQRSMAEAEKYSERIRLFMAAMVAATESGGLRQYKTEDSMWEKLDDESSSDMFIQLKMFLHIQKKGIGKTNETDLDINNVVQAEKLYRKIAHRSGIKEISKLSVPSVEERRILHECIMTGHAHSAYIPAERDAKDIMLFKSIARRNSNSGILRQISRRSVVSEYTNRPVVASPFGIEIKTSKGHDILKLLGNVTETTMQELGKFAVNNTEWLPTGHVLRGGKFVELQEQYLGNGSIATRATRERPAEASPALRARVIEHVKVNPGKHLTQLYGIKSELEELRRLSKTPVAPFTQDNIDDLIEQVTPEDANSPGHVDDLLRQMIESQSITIDSFVSAEERERIRRDAPSSIEVDGFTLKLQYSNGKPRVRNPTIEMVLGMEEEPMLPDGRQILFMVDGKPHTAQQYRRQLTLTGEL